MYLLSPEFFQAFADQRTEPEDEYHLFHPKALPRMAFP